MWINRKLCLEIDLVSFKNIVIVYSSVKRGSNFINKLSNSGLLIQVYQIWVMTFLYKKFCIFHTIECKKMLVNKLIGHTT